MSILWCRRPKIPQFGQLIYEVAVNRKAVAGKCYVFIKAVVLNGNERAAGDLSFVQNWLEGLKRREARD